MPRLCFTFVAARLGKGVHAIRLSNATAPMPNVDCLTIQPIVGFMNCGK